VLSCLYGSWFVSQRVLLGPPRCNLCDHLIKLSKSFNFFSISMSIFSSISLYFNSSNIFSSLLGARLYARMLEMNEMQSLF
jgi:hypothetical protein